MNEYLGPVGLWRASSFLHRRGFRRIARLLKATNYLVYRAILPPEACLGNNISLGHYGLNIVIHPNVTLGNNVHIWHGVTIAVSDSPGSSTRITIGDDCVLGANSVIISKKRRSMSLCSGSIVGANAVVSRTTVIPGTYIGVPARRIGEVG